MSHTALGPLAFWEGYEGELLTLLQYAVALAIYAVLVGTFYITLSQRDLRATKVAAKGPGLAGLLVILPLVSFGLFLVLTIALFFLAKKLDTVPEAQRVRDLMLISMAVVMGVRVTAYVNEHAAADLGKLVPLGLLGVFLVDPGLLDINNSLARLGTLASMLDHVARFFLVIILAEVVLRALWILTGGPARARKAQASPPSPQHR